MAHHGEALRRVLGDEPRADALIADWRTAPLSERERALCELAHALTVTPSAPHDAHHGRLREVGLDDEAVLHLVEIVAYFAFVNRLAEGLGVELEARFDR